MSMVTKKRQKAQRKFINGIHDEEMMTEIIRELVAIKKLSTSHVSRCYMLGKKSRRTKT